MSKITYNGQIIANPTNGKTATLKCAGMKMVSDVIVESINQENNSGIIDLTNIPVVDSICNPTMESPTAVKYDGEIYLLVKE